MVLFKQQKMANKNHIKIEKDEKEIVDIKQENYNNVKEFDIRGILSDQERDKD